MNELHHVYLSLGSNIEPETHLPKAIQYLRDYGEVKSISTVWESNAVGSDGPNFLNVCVLFLSHLQPVELKEKIIRPIEAELGRIAGRTGQNRSPADPPLDEKVSRHGATVYPGLQSESVTGRSGRRENEVRHLLYPQHVGRTGH